MEAKLEHPDPPSQAARPAPTMESAFQNRENEGLGGEALQSQGTELALRAPCSSKNIPLPHPGRRVGQCLLLDGGAVESQQTGRIWDGSWACCHQR